MAEDPIKLGIIGIVVSLIIFIANKLIRKYILPEHWGEIVGINYCKDNPKEKYVYQIKLRDDVPANIVYIPDDREYEMHRYLELLEWNGKLTVMDELSGNHVLLTSFCRSYHKFTLPLFALSLFILIVAIIV
jgi:hypothetical protein